MTRGVAMWVGVGLVIWGSSGCGDDACQELAEVCARCPAGGVAQTSCNTAVEAGDEVSCQDRLDQGTYEAQGCQ